MGLRGIALAHATLLSSDPPAGSIVSTAPRRITLLFNEPLEASLSQIALVDARGRATALEVSRNPRDVHALVAPVSPLPDGAYRVVWRTVSADGHAVDGSYVFRVHAHAEGAAMSSPDVEVDSAPPDIPPDETLAWGPTMVGAPLVLAFLRGAALAALMAAAGLLYFIGWGREANIVAPRSVKVAATSINLAILLLMAHLIGWLINGTPGHVLDLDWSRRALGSGPGAAEGWRIGLTLVALWALALARRPQVAALLSFAALLVSGAIGHPAAIVPLAAIPAKALHLMATALWLGGLLWLVLLSTDDEPRFRREAERVSSAALAAVVVVALSGAVQSVLFLPTLGALLSTPYGWILIWKMIGMAVLIAFGAHHRYRVMPARPLRPAVTQAMAASDLAWPMRLRRSVWREVAVMGMVILLGAWLAYVSPNATYPPTGAGATPGTTHR